MTKAHGLLAGLLPRELLKGFTYQRVREVLASLEGYAEGELLAAAEAAKGLGVRGPLAAAVFVLNHLRGGHEVEVDRVAENEGTGERLAELVYPEGEVTVRLVALGGGVEACHRVATILSRGGTAPPEVISGRRRC